MSKDNNKNVLLKVSERVRVRARVRARVRLGCAIYLVCTYVVCSGFSLHHSFVVGQ